MCGVMSLLFLLLRDPREPAQDLLQSFVQHWKGVTQYYIETSDESCPARNTDIPWRLRQLLDILVYEEGETAGREDEGNGEASGPAGNTGPCMEYLLQHKILETLCTLAKAEYPPGMRQQVLLFFGRLLSKVHRPLLHYINVHRPVQRLIALGGDTVGVTAHKEELQFLKSVCCKLEADPSLIIHILEDENLKRTPSTEDSQETAAALANRKPKNTIFKALIRLCLCQSQQGHLAVRAREALFGVLRASQQEVPARLIAQSDLSQLVTERLCDLHNNIPLSTHPCDITSQEGTDWRANVNKEDLDAMPPEIAAVRRFLCWVEFCDSVLQESHKMVATSIANCITEVYLRGKLQEELLHVSELHILRSTALLTALLQRLHPSPLLHQLLIYLLGEERSPESRNNKDPLLRSQLIQRCNHLSDEISLTSMRLFEEILKVSDELALYNLVVRNVQTRDYLAGGNEDGRVQEGEVFEGTEDLEEDPYFTDGLPDTGLQMMGRAQGHLGRLAESSGAEQSVKSFLSLVPEEMKSSSSGFDSYLQDAMVQYQGCCKLAAQWSWPSTPQAISSSPSGQEFYEGQFLQVLFDRLGGILDQPYDMNLQITSLLARISLFPHPLIQEYLLDPYMNLAPGARSLFSVLVRVVGDLAQRSLRVANFQETLQLVRQQLLGETTDEPLGHETLCRGVIVLEEFCKELAAAACVTHHPLGV
ncbi:FHF complex subunit HOOK-interacting protein 2B isoform X2 [Hyperolius riggenbachi]|uniref:FHF complex subunit HOOK-interacting protein 2B isoform X2 n=1 Tax=Hyperolius riggenbachi TaxID=752182 RepID=UPI0035A3267F